MDPKDQNLPGQVPPDHRHFPITLGLVACHSLSPRSGPESMKSSIPSESDRKSSTKTAERVLDRQQKGLEGKALVSRMEESNQMHHDHLDHIKAAHDVELANVTLLAKRQIHGARMVSRRAPEERRKTKKKLQEVARRHDVEKKQLKVLYEQQDKLAKFDQDVVRGSLVQKDQANNAEKMKVRRNHQAAMRESRDKLQSTEARLRVKNMLLEAEERKTASLRDAIMAQRAKDIEIRQLRADNDDHVACIRWLQLALLSKNRSRIDSQLSFISGYSTIRTWQGYSSTRPWVPAQNPLRHPLPTDPLDVRAQEADSQPLEVQTSSQILPKQTIPHTNIWATDQYEANFQPQTGQPSGLAYSEQSQEYRQSPGSQGRDQYSRGSFHSPQTPPCVSIHSVNHKQHDSRWVPKHSLNEIQSQQRLSQANICATDQIPTRLQPPSQLHAPASVHARLSPYHKEDHQAKTTTGGKSTSASAAYPNVWSPWNPPDVGRKSSQ
ncbi:MAG: hypothetical protein Q9183_000926 [Haloplaca sp. 2 TL-2023]